MKQQKITNNKFYRHLSLAVASLIIGLAAWICLINYTAGSMHWNGQQGYLTALAMAPLYLLIFAVISLSLLWLVNNLVRKLTENSNWSRRKINRRYIAIIAILGLLLILIAIISAVNYIIKYNNLIKV